MRKGFSLLETLVVITIISILAGILLPVLAGSKKSAYRGDDMSKLRQMSVAASLYEDRYGEFPLSTSQLVSTGLVPPELCASMRDSTSEGLANMLAKFSSRRYAGPEQAGAAPYKSSFIGLGEFGLAPSAFRDYVLTGPNAGWLIDVTESIKTEIPTPTQWEGNYRRLTMEGSVITRQHKDYQCYNDGERKPCRMSVLLFVDPNPHFEELQRSSSQ
jgi:prepilin-type N-terminal cleavage/methylation domain-containing protein